MAEIDPATKFQMTPSWQVGVDVSLPASGLLTWDDTPGISLRVWLDSLDANPDGVFGTLDILNTNYDITPGTPVTLPDFVTQVTVDGEVGVPDPSNGEVDITLDAIREILPLVTPDDSTGAVSIEDRPAPNLGDGKALQVKFPMTPSVVGLGDLAFTMTVNDPNWNGAPSTFRKLDDTYVNASIDPTGAVLWDIPQSRIVLTDEYDYILCYDIRIQETSGTSFTGTAEDKDNFDVIFSITRNQLEGNDTTLQNRTAWHHDRRENLDSSACCQFSGMIPITVSQSTENLQIWSYGDAGSAGGVDQYTTSGSIWVYRVPSGTFTI